MRTRNNKTSVYRAASWTGLFVILFFVIYAFFTGKKVISNNHDYLVNDTIQSAEYIENTIEEGYNNIKVLSELIGQSLKSPELNIADYQRIINNSVFDFVEFADKNGVDHNITGGTSNAVDRKYYVDAMDGHTGMEVIINSRATHENLMMFYAPVYYENEIIGSLIGVYEGKERITQLLKTLYFEEYATSYLCTSEGVVFAGYGDFDTNQSYYIWDLLEISDSKKNVIKRNIELGKDCEFYVKKINSTGYLMPILGGEWVLVQVYPSSVNIRMMVEMVFLAFLLVLSILVVYILNQRVMLGSYRRQESTINMQESLLESVADIYYSMHLINLEDYSIEKLEANSLMDEVVNSGVNASDMLNRIVNETIDSKFKQAALEFVDLETLADRLKNKNSVFMDAIDKNVGWLRMTFISVEQDEENKPLKVIIATQVVDEDKKREEELSIMANVDELTRLYNRRAYEDDILNYPDVPVEPDFVYLAIDINGLKNVNDNLGHAAGDEVIKGAALCLKKTLGNYGRVYRTGGDEFVSMIFADEEHLKSVIKELNHMTDNWVGELVPSLSISVGYVTKREFTTETVIEMAKIADERMYKAKAKYYSEKGVDRRGQAAAHNALCKLYTKILKINLTKDDFSIISMDSSEKNDEFGYSETISDWFIGFAKAGEVHEEDTEEYLAKTDIEFLKEYFRKDKTSISIHYRRKYQDGFKQVIMEMIPADDYTDDNQSLFLYVKAVDK